jgi:glycosyltransferase involved in cell wall biosynthesis
MKLSIITINYNNQTGLKRTIDSVISQSFSDFEWIIIDGGSGDGSRKLLEQHSDRIDYWVSEPDKGIYNAMNKGIKQAKGDWFLFLNSGDWFFDNDVLTKVFDSPHDADIIYGDAMYYWSDTRGTQLVQKPDSLSLYYFYTDTLCHQATFYKSEIFKTHQYNENFRICSDWALYIQLLTEGYKFLHLPICITHFPQDGISTHLNESHLAERKRVIEEYIPSYIIPDLERLRMIDERKKHIASHRSYHSIMSRAEKRVIRMEKIVRLIEKLRSK